MIEWLFVPMAYLLGSISSAIIVCKIMGLPDPRNEGSGNPGATNVMRIGGKKAAITTLLGDCLKGLIPVLVVKLYGVPEVILAAVAIAAFLGHLYPVFFAFQGGKGVATSFGVLLGISWVLGSAVFVTWLVIYKLFRISSLSALVTAVLTPIFVWLLMDSMALTVASVLMSALLVWRHRGNIQRLLAGEET